MLQHESIVVGFVPRALIAGLLFFICVASASGQLSYTFNNPAPITINDNQPASPYPSAINVTNLPSRVAKVTVRLNGFNHTFTSDVDIMLVGPGGQQAMIMSDVGGSSNVNNVTLTLDDAAAATIPSPPATGTFRPLNVDTTSDNMPSPAPTPTGNAMLSVFNDTNPNGTWRLFVRDDVGADSGVITGGWTLTITSAVNGENQGAITIPDSGTATPYPSEIQIADLPGLISYVQVNVQNFSHSSPDDVDLMLVAPSGRRVVLMSDVGGTTPVNGITLTFDDQAAAYMPDTDQLTGGTYKPSDYEGGDTFPPPAGPHTGRLLSSLHGTSANGTWQLFLVDDSGNNAGTVSGGWSITIDTSSNLVVIPDVGPAEPYPAPITVTGLAGSITRATVTLTNFSHRSPDDVDIMLVSPSGRRIVLMSDAGGINEVGSLTLTFDDQATGMLPDNDVLLSGTYRPSNYEPGDAFPSPAPTGPVSGTTMNAFYGSAPNGVWRLYAVDDNGNQSGSFSGNWTVNLQTSTSACLFSLSPTEQAFPVSGGNGAFNITMPAGCSWSVGAVSNFLSVTSATSGEGNGTLSFSVAANTGPARTGSIVITNGVNSRNFLVQQPSGCPTSATQSAMSFGPGGGPGSVPITAAAGCNWVGETNSFWIQITSPPQSGNGNLQFNVLPNPTGSPRTGTIVVGALTIVVNQLGITRAVSDFDGDSRTDLSVYRPSTGVWWVATSGNGSHFASPFGIPTDRIAPADYDGDRKTDQAVYRDGEWIIYLSATGTVRYGTFGVAEDKPVPADFDGDGRAELAVYRPSSGVWHLLRSTDGGYIAQAFGIPTDIPIPADYDGDGRADIAIYRAGTSPGAQSTWAILQSTNGSAVFRLFGTQGDIPAVGDYDGDARDNIAVFRPSTGTWYTSLDPATNYGAVQFGAAGDIPVPGDYNGDGRVDHAVFRQGVWHIRQSGSGATVGGQWGVSGDKPVPSAYIP
jgi:subtilisin-like proprotein convertase family protein